MDDKQKAINILIDRCDKKCGECSIRVQCEELATYCNFYCDLEPIKTELKGVK